MEEVVIPVAAVPATTGSLRTTVHVTGAVRPWEGAEFFVHAPETARLVDVTKRAGDRVTSGEVLARFDLPQAVQAVSRQRAEVARLQSDLERVKQAHARVLDFVARGLVPRRDRDDADRQLSEAETALRQATGALATAEAAVTRDTVRATFDGVVAARLHEPGDLVQGITTDPVLRVIDPKRVEIVATVEDADVPRVVPGASARAADPKDGALVTLAVAAAPMRSASSGGSSGGSSGRSTVRLSFARPSTIPVDTVLEIEIDAEERHDIVFVVPEAVLTIGGEAVVMVAEGDRASRRVVTTGITNNGQVEILTGIRAGDLVITRGQAGLADGTLISAVVERPTVSGASTP